MAKGGKSTKALMGIVAPMGKEELKMIGLYLGLLDEIDDEEAWYLFRKMISESAHHLTLDTEMLLQLAPGERKGAATRAELEYLRGKLDLAEKGEQKAYDMYDRALAKMDDPYMKQTVRWIRDEEEKHVRMVRELKEIVTRKLSRM